MVGMPISEARSPVNEQLGPSFKVDNRKGEVIKKPARRRTGILDELVRTSAFLVKRESLTREGIARKTGRAKQF
jgi:hypothetical protein